ncbi:hypothetical protein QJS83_01410 [Bdellovibrio sp. 22V]|uniref:hypothetical protein n=1 Tax=Bdellovibrio sp. 22V TaxID=3044166 RepID=UPI002542E10A|nr:hypothetical protein [Bdellovibrio sp. 22V]WII72526.1 hypothetical protein QJS83_01410 [Bdellovibrio sp. 22V]
MIIPVTDTILMPSVVPLSGSEANKYISDLVTAGGPLATEYAPPSPLLCADPNMNDFCGMGYTWTSSPGGAVARGGSYYNGTDTGILALDLDNAPNYSNTHVGFRCVAPATEIQ